MSLYLLFGNFPLVKKFYSFIIVLMAAALNFRRRSFIFHFSLFIFLFFCAYFVETSILKLNQAFASEKKEDSSMENSSLKKAISSSSELSKSRQKKDKGVKTSVEKLEVTGTQIRQIDVETFYPIKTFDKEYLEQTGATTLGDALRESPFFFQGVTREDPLSGAPGRQGAKGGGLILINGLRAAYPDLASFPLEFIEKVDYLYVGTIGNYGTTSVINIITKKNSTKRGISIHYDHPFLVKKGKKLKDYFERGGSGKRFRGGIEAGYQITPYWNMNGALSYRWSQALKSKDRDFSKPHMSSGGTGFPGTYLDEKGVWHPHPDCPEDYIAPIPNGAFCNIDITDLGADFLPETHQFGGLLNSTLRLSDLVDFYFEASFSKRITRSVLAAQPLLTDIHFKYYDEWKEWLKEGGGTISLPEGNGPWTRVKMRTFRARLKGKNRINRVERLWHNIQSVFDVDFNDRWDGRVSLSWGKSVYSNFAEQGLLIREGIVGVFRNGEYRPFGPEDKRGTPPVNTQDEGLVRKSDLSYIFNASSSLLLFDWPWKEGGPFLISAFTETRYNYSKTKLLEGTDNLVSSVSDSDETSLQRFYLHNVQLISQFFPFLDFTLSGVLKHDSSSEDLKFTPQASFRSKLSNKLLIRGNLEYSVGTVSLESKKAKVQGQGNPSVVDYFFCTSEAVRSEEEKNRNCSGYQINRLTYGNPNLKPSKTWRAHLGGYFEFNDWISLNLNGWYEKTEGLGLDYQDLIRIERDKGEEAIKTIKDKIKVKLVDQEDRKFAEYKNREVSIDVKREEVGDGIGTVNELHHVYNNEVENVEYGFDLGFLFIVPQTVFGGKLKIGETIYSVLFSENAVPLVNWKRKLIGLYDVPKWRSRSFIQWQKNSHHIGLRIHSVSPIKNFLETVERGRHPMYAQVDLDYKVMMSIYKNFKGEFNIGIKNIFNDSPPFDKDAKPHVSEMFRDDLYEPRGRVVYMKYKQYF